MEQARKIFGLKKEAVLLDSWLYITKSMLAIGTGFLLGSMFSVTRLDMISVLLGVMYNLEATNISAVKGGINQLLASFLGAVTTGILVSILGVNVVTIMLGMGLTLYIALKIDYTAVSPVAIFTSIYMTQFLQSDALGNPSIYLTIRLRIFALGLGVAVALLFNFLFSFVYYRKITRKRLEYVKLKLDEVMALTYDYLTKDIAENTISYNPAFSQVFAHIDAVATNLAALEKDPLIPFKVLEKKNLITAMTMISKLKLLAHLAYNSCYMKEVYRVDFQEKHLKSLGDFNHKLKQLDFLKVEPDSDAFMPHFPVPEHDDEEAKRIYENLDLIFTEYNALVELHHQMK